MRSRRGLILLTLVAVLSGCGGGDGGGSGDAPDEVSLTVTEPADGARTRKATIKVVGTAAGAAEVTVNGKSATLRPSGAARSFEVPVRLRVGKNEIVIEASGDGRRTRRTITVVRKRARGRGDSGGKPGGESRGAPGGSPQTVPEPPPNQGAPPAEPAPPNQGAPPASPAPPNQGAPPAPAPPPPQGAPPAPGDGG